jgi:hypothetical protein
VPDWQIRFVTIVESTSTELVAIAEGAASFLIDEYGL